MADEFASVLPSRAVRSGVERVRVSLQGEDLKQALLDWFRDNIGAPPGATVNLDDDSAEIEAVIEWEDET